MNKNSHEIEENAERLKTLKYNLEKEYERTDLFEQEWIIPMDRKKIPIDKIESNTNEIKT